MNHPGDAEDLINDETCDHGTPYDAPCDGCDLKFPDNVKVRNELRAGICTTNREQRERTRTPEQIEAEWRAYAEARLPIIEPIPQPQVGAGVNMNGAASRVTKPGFERFAMPHDRETIGTLRGSIADNLIDFETNSEIDAVVDAANSERSPFRSTSPSFGDEFCQTPEEILSDTRGYVPPRPRGHGVLPPDYARPRSSLREKVAMIAYVGLAWLEDKISNAKGRLLLLQVAPFSPLDLPVKKYDGMVDYGPGLDMRYSPLPGLETHMPMYSPFGQDFYYAVDYSHEERRVDAQVLPYFYTGIFS